MPHPNCDCAATGNEHGLMRNQSTILKLNISPSPPYRLTPQNDAVLTEGCYHRHFKRSLYWCIQEELMNKRKTIAVLLSVTMILTMACGIINTLTGGGGSGTV